MRAIWFLEWPSGFGIRSIVRAALAGIFLAEAQGGAADESARARLEMLGSAPTGEGFVRAVASRHRPVIDLFIAEAPVGTWVSITR